MISKIKHKIRLREYEFSKHAVDQSILRDISVPDLEEALLGDCIIVEDYPEDKYGPSCCKHSGVKSEDPNLDDL